MSQFQLDRADIQKALDWFLRQPPPKPLKAAIIKADAKQLRVELQDCDLHRFIPNFNVEISVCPSLDGQDLMIKFQGENLFGKLGGLLVWFSEKTGIKREGEFHKIESGDAVRFYLPKISLGQHGKLGDLVTFTHVAWINNRLELDFKTR